MKHPFWTISMLFILLSSNSPLLFAQNLIPNPSFENWDGTSGQGGNTLDGLDNWYNANGTADHHHTSISGTNLTSLEPCPLGQGNEWCGAPVEGEAVLGCWKGNGLDGTREWAGIQLTSAMTTGNCYKVSFWVQNKEDNPNSLYETNQWGIFFSETMFPTFSPNVADYTNRLDQIVMTDEVVGDTIWHYYEFIYQANAPHQYAYVGYQGNVASSTFTAANPSFTLGFYVWFDLISVTPIEVDLSLSEDITICPGDSVLLEANSNYPVIWSHQNPDTTSSVWIAPQETTTYYVQTQDSTVCTIIDSVVVTVIPETVTEYTDLVCLGSDAFPLASNNSDGNWTGNGIINESLGLFDPNEAGLGTHEIRFESNNHCSESFTLLIDILDTPTLDFESDINTGCAPANIHFTDLSQSTGITYHWDFGNGTTSNDVGTTSINYTDPGLYDVQLSVSYSEHCTASLTQDNWIQLGESPFANFTFSPSTITNLEPEVQFENLSSQNINSFSWHFGDGNSSIQMNPHHEYSLPGNYEAQLIVTSPEGCQDSTSQLITVNNQIDFYIPNAFSPNDDGINDSFDVFPAGEITTYQITIFDRWGGTVFQSSKIDEPWDGYIKGKLAPKGIYVYLIEYEFADYINGGLQKGNRSGDVMIMR